MSAPRARSRSALAPPRREQKKAESRRRILEAARAVFFRDGFMPANLDEVAELAEVAKGTLYRYFESKAELYVAVLAHDGALFERKLRETLAPELSPPEQIRCTGRFYLEHWMRNRDYFRIFWAIENQEVIGELPRGVIQEITKLWEQCLQLLADIVARGIDEGHLPRVRSLAGRAPALDARERADPDGGIGRPPQAAPRRARAGLRGRHRDRLARPGRASARRALDAGSGLRKLPALGGGLERCRKTSERGFGRSWWSSWASSRPR